MTIRFWKMHGAGNDFVVVDDREQTFPSDDAAWLTAVAARRRGIGCDGFILIQRHDSADFRMRFINPDASEANMCGNGLRCACRLARDLGIAGDTMQVATAAGCLPGVCLGDAVRVGLPPVPETPRAGVLTIDGRPVAYAAVNTGVPHAVIRTDELELDRDPVTALGAGVRYHADFAPAGTNADFIAIDNALRVRIRTYERGVEAETLACGTGVVAAAIVAAYDGPVRPPVDVTTAGGDVLTVAFDFSNGRVTGITLTGPATHVYEGTIAYTP